MENINSVYKIKLKFKSFILITKKTHFSRFRLKNLVQKIQHPDILNSYYIFTLTRINPVFRCD